MRKQKAETIEKMVQGEFQLVVHNADTGEIENIIREPNLVTLTAYKKLLSIVAGDKDNTSLTRLILGTDGLKADGNVKDENDGFDINLTDLFSVANSKPYYEITWQKQNNTSAGITNINAKTVNTTQKDGVGTPEISLYYDNAANRVYFNIKLSAEIGNLTDPSQVTAYSEAALYFGDKIFAAKVFPIVSKSNRKTLEITWMWKTILDSQDGITFTIDMSKVSGNQFTLPFKTNTHKLTIDWDDGTSEQTVAANTGSIDSDSYKHVYSTKGVFEIRVIGESIPNFDFSKLEALKVALISIDNMSAPFQSNEFTGMFEDCVNLTSIPKTLFRYNTEATSFEKTFKGCTSLSTVPKGILSTNTKVTNVISMFEGCSELYVTPGFLENDTIKMYLLQNREKMAKMLDGCKSSLSFEVDLKTTKFILPLDYDNNSEMLVYFDTELYGLVPLKGGNEQYYGHTFSTTGKKTIRIFADSLPKFNFTRSELLNTQILKINECREEFVSDVETDLSGMFEGCSNLTSVPDTLFSQNPKLTNVARMFKNCVKLTNGTFIDNPNIRDFTQAFYNCPAFIMKDNLINGAITSDPIILESCVFLEMFYRRTNDHTSTSETAPKIWTDEILGTSEDELAFGGEGNTGLTNYESIPDILKKSYLQIEIDTGTETSVDLKLSSTRSVYWGDDTSASLGGTHTYKNAGKYEVKIYGIDAMSEWNTLNSDLGKMLTKVIKVGDAVLPTTHTFEGCYNLKELPQDIWMLLEATAEDFSFAFSGCENLTVFPEFTKFTNAKKFTRTFEACHQLESIPNGVLKDGVTDLDFTFKDCDKITDVQSTLPSGVTTVEGMFYSCSNLKTINSEFFKKSLSTITNYANCFYGCSTLTVTANTIDAANITVPANFNGMFLLSEKFDESKYFFLKGQSQSGSKQNVILVDSTGKTAQLDIQTNIDISDITLEYVSPLTTSHGTLDLTAKTYTYVSAPDGANAQKINLYYDDLLIGTVNICYNGAQDSQIKSTNINFDDRQGSEYIDIRGKDERNLFLVTQDGDKFTYFDIDTNIPISSISVSYTSPLTENNGTLNLTEGSYRFLTKPSLASTVKYAEIKLTYSSVQMGSIYLYYDKPLLKETDVKSTNIDYVHAADNSLYFKLKAREVHNNNEVLIPSTTSANSAIPLKITQNVGLENLTFSYTAPLTEDNGTLDLKNSQYVFKSRPNQTGTSTPVDYAEIKVLYNDSEIGTINLNYVTTSPKATHIWYNPNPNTSGLLELSNTAPNIYSNTKALSGSKAFGPKELWTNWSDIPNDWKVIS